MIAQSETETLLRQADGTYKTGTNTSYYNSNGLIVAADHDPQGLTENCTTTTYATPPSGGSNMVSYPAQVTNVSGAYSTSANSCPAVTASNIISDTKTYYDDKSSTISTTGMGTLGSLAYPGGLITGTQTASSWPIRRVRAMAAGDRDHV